MRIGNIVYIECREMAPEDLFADADLERREDVARPMEAQARPREAELVEPQR
jgi:hypothetical protein